jgi:hypothetical protein
VEAIAGKREGKEKVGRKWVETVLYLVYWKGFPAADASWEPLDNLAGAMDLVNDYERSTFVQAHGRVSVLRLALLMG